MSFRQKDGLADDWTDGRMNLLTILYRYKDASWKTRRQNQKLFSKKDLVFKPATSFFLFAWKKKAITISEFFPSSADLDDLTHSFPFSLPSDQTENEKKQKHQQYFSGSDFLLKTSRGFRIFVFVTRICRHSTPHFLRFSTQSTTFLWLSPSF